MAKRHQPPKQDVSLNLTSLLDVIFQLIVFFLLVTNFTSLELPEMKPPEPDNSQARETQRRERIVVNVMPEATSGRVKGVRVGSTRNIPPGNYGQLTALLEQEKEKKGSPDSDNPEDRLQVDLRADTTVHYENVQPVMNAITAAGIARINLVAKTDDTNTQPAD